MTVFNFRNFDVMIACTYQPGDLVQLQQCVSGICTPLKVGILSAGVSRRKEDIINTGKLAAELFDEIIITHNDELHGRENEAMTCLLIKGISSVKDMALKVIACEKEAIAHAIEHASEGCAIVICADNPAPAVSQVHALLANEKREPVTGMQRLVFAKTGWL